MNHSYLSPSTMNRRTFLQTTAAAVAATPIAVAFGAPNESSTREVKGIATENWKLKRPTTGSIPVAMLVSENVNVIDLSGPWGVFESVQVRDAMEPPFQLFTVA